MIPREAVPWLLGIFGAFIGSFLNVCIHRMPAHRSIVWPGSACPACGAPIRAWQNVPILSWALLRGRCAACAVPISWRYPFVEALTSALFVLCWFRFGAGWDLVRALLFLPAMIVLFYTDLDERILPDLVTLPGTAAGIGLAFLAALVWPFGEAGSWRGGLWAAGSAALVAVGAGGSLWLVGRLWRFVRPGIETAMGEGDVKMMAMIGAFLGARLALMTVFLGSVLGTLIFLATRLVLLTVRGRAAVREPSVTASPIAVAPRLGALGRGLERAGFLVEGRGAGLLDQIPFGSMLAIGAAVSLLWGEGLARSYAAFSLGLGDWLSNLLGGGG
jgi:leader peptidase (prepilin peptidase)/N-methyltransferase